MASANELFSSLDSPQSITSSAAPAGEGGGVARAQKYKLIHPHSHPTPCLSFPWVNAGAASSTWAVVVFGGASWCLGENGDEEVFPYCINEYLYD
uniref:Uncharacterized protein n=1 Tax=Sus scrofa TaxID=9823 RepID=A0A4X1T6H2_PIG